LDYRPLRFDEFEQRVHQVIHVSATPGAYELAKAGDAIVEMIVRPNRTWLDPLIEIEPKANQLQHLVGEIRKRAARGEHVLVNAVTKRAAEDVAACLNKQGIRSAWMHDALDTQERVSLLDDLREGKLDTIVAVNLLREGIDLPSVSMVAVLDADRPGMLRCRKSLTQYVGRAARNPRGKAIFYADTVTEAMARVNRESRRRRQLQDEANCEYNARPA
jgi:excinuclease ABC subunit B